MDFTFFNYLILILATSAIAVALFKRLQLPEILGYLFVGIIFAPTTTGIIPPDFDISLLAEIGVVFLLFTLGLEFSVQTILAMKKEVFGLGGLQVVLSVLALFTIFQLLNFPFLSSLVCAGALALSSTAIVSKELTQSNMIRARQGQIAIGVLLFQDIAAVIFLILLPTLLASGEHSFSISLAIALIKGTLFVIVMLSLGKWVLPYIFHEVAKARSEELFVLLALVIALIAAWLSHELGLSMALGGFIAGMMMGESRYKHQVEADIKPFRDVLLGLFFVSVGLMLDMDVLIQFWPQVILGTFTLIIIKLSLIYGLALGLGESKNIALRAGLSLAQGGEFCFALIALATQYGEDSGNLFSIVLAVTILSMIIAPLLIRNSTRVIHWFKLNPSKPLDAPEEDMQQIAHIHHHTLICGYGRVGQTIARFLEKENKPYVAIDDDPMHVKEARLAGELVFYGDCRKKELLQAVGIYRACQVIVCVDNAESALTTIQSIQQLLPDTPVLVRTRDDHLSEQLREAGATIVIPEILESSLIIVKHALLMLGVSPEKVRARLREARNEGYQSLNSFYPGLSDYLAENSHHHRHAVTIDAASAVCGKSLTEIDLTKWQADIVELKRDNCIIDINDTFVMQANDTLIFTAPNNQIASIERYLLKSTKHPSA